jgi:ParB family chromosome partitioning protein
VTEIIYTIDPGEIVIPSDRIRKEFDENKIRKLADSFKLYGQISPALCKKAGNKIVLVAGERRSRACKLADMDLKYVLTDEADAITLREIELEENIQRENLTWTEEVNAKLELHDLQQTKHGAAEVGKSGGHGVAETAQMLGESIGNVAEDLELANYAEHFDEVREAKKKTDAKKIVKRIKAELKRSIQLEKAEIKEDKDSSKPHAQQAFDEQLLRYSERIIEGKLEDTIGQFEDGHFQVVIWDPPWQVGLDKVRKKGGGTRDFKDSDDPEFERFTSQLEQITQKMAEHSHIYIFFGIVHYERVYGIIKDAKLETNGIPIIWYKQGSHVTRNPTIWPGRSYEPIAFARKGTKDLVRQGSPDLIITPMPTEAIKQSHPSAKHPDVILELLQRSAAPGDRILDPMCGSGMTGVAAETLCNSHKLDWWMIEEMPDFRNLAVINVSQGYSRLIAFTPDKLPIPEYVIPSIPDDYHEIEVGSSAWKQFWEQNPDSQAEMLAWKKGEQHEARPG